MEGVYVALGLLAAYLALVVWLVQTGRLQRWNLSLMLGVILMVRTQRGKGLLDVLARPRRLWNAFADAGTVVTLAGMALMTLVFAWSVWFSLQPGSGLQPLGASEILVIPGVNPFVPLWYGLVALIFTLVVHEGGHGILARANQMRVKSMGLLVAVVPIGAFVEPDDEDLRLASRRRRLRVFAAGPTVNLTFAVLALVGFSAMVGAATPV
ncbi:MAG TPA: site-2 protease family protein, partial [Candidatus Thermoplasmatota archaeon]|nr:site-2 protease family protein [Candidatus Thermoplasmatota archaeon]